MKPKVYEANGEGNMFALYTNIKKMTEYDG